MSFAQIKALAEAGEFDQVIEAAGQRLNHNPDDSVMYYMAARSLSEKGLAALAEPVALKAATLAPTVWEAWNLLGKCQSDIWKLDESKENFRLALQLSPRQSAPLANMAMADYLMGRTDKAIELCQKALALNPDCENTKNNLGMFLLALKQWEPGWDLYEHGLGNHFSRKERVYGNEPRWDGSKDKTVVVYGEQGIGDEISFASCIPNLVSDAKLAVVECDSRLEGLFKRSFPKAHVYGTRYHKEPHWLGRYEFDGRCSIGSLSRIYRRRDSDFTGVAYLKADDERRVQWRALLSGMPGLKVGIAWTGGNILNGRQLRSLSLDDLLPILSLPASFVSLEYRDPTSEREAFTEKHGIHIHEWGRATRTQDYDDCAALVAELDLVISVTTSVIHLAGALGKEAWVLTPKNPMWRYGRSGDSMPWYNSIKLYRQKTDWNYPIMKIAEDLSARIQS